MRMRKPKICYLWLEFVDGSAGGAISHMEGFLSGLEHAGCEVSIISPKKFEFLEGHQNTKYLGWETKAAFLANANFLKCGQIKRIVEKEKPDLIYQRHVAFTDVGARLAKDLKIPFVLEYNGPLTWVIRHWAKNYVLRIIAYILSPVSDYYERSAIRSAAKITVVSKPLEEILIRMDVSKDKIILNPNGVDTQKFNPKISGETIRKKYKIPQSAVVVGFLGTYDRWHGAEVLAKAAREIAERKDIYFLFMGEGYYRKQAEEAAGNDKKIIFTGPVSCERVPEHLAACNILVNPTVPNPDGTEFFGSPTKLFEYMAMGKAIVSSNIGQMKEILENKKDALLVEAGNSRALEEAVLAFAEDKKMREILGRNARNKVEKKYTWEMNAKRVLKAYEELQ